MYVLILNNENNVIAKAKTIDRENISINEIEITEEQYNEINEFPIALILDENGKVVAWEKTEIEYEPIPEQPQLPTIEDYLVDLDFRVSLIELEV